MIKVTFQPSNKVVTVPAGSNILQAVISAGVQVESTCGGKGTCGKCKVKISDQQLTPVSPVEARFLSVAELADGWALACQRSLDANTVVELREQKDAHSRKVGFNGMKRIADVSPSVRKQAISLPRPSAADQTPDWDRLLAALPCMGIRFNRLLAASLPQIMRQDNYRVTAVLDGNELVAIESGDTIERCFGLAVDIGTTTVVVYLINLNVGTVVASDALGNPQQIFGADVISRITYAAGGPEKIRELQERIVDGLNDIINRLCGANQVSPQEIYQSVVVGNTTMSHLFLGVDPTYLAPAPFIPVFREAVEVEARELGLKILGTGKVLVLPNIAGYVGSDTVGVMLAASVDYMEGINLVVDVGTNGEIILAGKGRILTCSIAAGPAFEGAEIKYGMRAAKGAIEGVSISTDVEFAVIGNGKAQGICGSGLIDAIAQLYKSGVVDSSGRFVSKTAQLEKLPSSLRERRRKTEQGNEFVLVWAKDSSTGEDIVLSQKDIRELQLAKGAVMAGVRMLMREMGVTPEEIDRVLLAGAFGNYINKESALRIGMLPSISLERITAIGNAAGDGAIMALLSRNERSRAVNLAKRAEHIELSNKKEFQMEFINSLPFISID